jgi:exodeoxyribonuclease V alpha subunit
METETVTGIIRHIAFRNPDNGYTILKIVPDEDYHAQNSDGTLSVVCTMDEAPKVGDAVEFKGYFVDNPKFGTQLSAQKYKRVEKSAKHVPLPNIPGLTTASALASRGVIPKGDESSLKGTVLRVTFYNPENGWSVIKIEPFEKEKYPAEAMYDGSIAVVGVMPELVEGEAAQFTGKWVNNEQYGKQFKADNVVPISPSNKQGIIRYISETVFGIGEVTATKIYNHFGDKTMEILDSDPNKIFEVKGLKPNIAQNLITQWGENRSVRQIMIHLQSYGITMKLAKKIYDEYGAQTLSIVQTDPYQLADDLHGVGFKKADQIAQGIGIQADDPARLRAGLVYTLSQMANDGHTYAPRDVLMEKAVEILGVAGDDLNLIQQIQEQILAGKLKADILYHDTPQQIGAIYLPMFYHSEIGVANKLRVMATSPSRIITSMKETKWDSYLSELAKENSVNLSPEQQGAVKGALTSKVSVLTGGPGTGKTTTLRMVINALEQEGYRYLLASPTGRAAKRLAEATGEEAKTIHRTLGFNPYEFGFEFNEENPLDTDVVIIDESSMIDLILFYDLLKAIKPGTHLMLVGDIDQLPSVGAGNVLNDVISSGIAHVTRLSRIFRQDDASHIVLNAHRINHGEMPYTDNESDDFYFFNMGEPNEAADLVVELVRDRLKKKVGDYDPINDIQVIAPMYRGPIGVDALNQALQEALNPSNPRRIEKKLGNKIFRKGDKVMQTKNNYDKDVFNGDIGIIHGIDEVDSKIEVVIDGRFVGYDFVDAEEQLIHAYCISTHRSQGSEYPIVVMPVMTQHFMMLQRNLLYTAITRAKKMVVLVGTRKALSIAVDNNKVAERYSGLEARLKTGKVQKTLL